MTFTNGSHRATELSSLLPSHGGHGTRTLEAGPGAADPCPDCGAPINSGNCPSCRHLRAERNQHAATIRRPIRAGIQIALWDMVDTGRADQYIGTALSSMEQGELVTLAAAALARLERLELDNAA